MLFCLRQGILHRSQKHRRVIDSCVYWGTVSGPKNPLRPVTNYEMVLLGISLAATCDSMLL